MDDGPSYFAVATIVKRSDGLHEMLGRMTRKGNGVAFYHKEAFEYLIEQGLRVAWTVETSKMHLYKRLLRSVGRLRILRTFTKRYNEQDIEFSYGEIVPLGNPT